MLKPLTNFSCFSFPKCMQETNQLIQKHTIIALLKTCSKLKELESIYAIMIKNFTYQDCYLINQFIAACSSFNQLDFANLAFTLMENPNVFVYNAMIRASVQCSSPFQALELYLDMLEVQVLPSSFTFSSLVKACTLVSAPWFGETVHGQIWKNGLETHVFVQTTLIDFYSNLNKLSESRRVFDEMPKRDVFAWTTMISTYARVGNMCFARRLFDDMPGRNIATWNTMIDGYAKLGDVKFAKELFDQMPMRDIISWTTMIKCYSQQKQFSEAISVFNEMRNNGIIPDEVTMATVISACAHLGVLELGKSLHFYVMQNCFDLDVYIGSALIDMYAKCGTLDRSLVVFFKLQKRNLFCWNAVIEGLAVHGYAEEALAMFDRMEKVNVKPNGVTFISVFTACTHAGLVEEGRRRFLSMTHDFSIAPEVEHYGCMVDLLARAGLLEDALELIRAMKMTPNSVIWGAFLGGCKLHRNLEIAQVAVNELVILEPENSGYYNLLVNMYADANQWNEVAKVRKAMKKLGVEKICPGSSWIELEGEIHKFAASDKSHQDSHEIHLLLAELDGQLMLACHVPNFGCLQ